MKGTDAEALNPVAYRVEEVGGLDKLEGINDDVPDEVRLLCPAPCGGEKGS
jgi:hypothetical protein